MDDFQDLLLEGERIVWTGRPDRSLDNIRQRLRFRELLTLLIVLIIVVACHFYFGIATAVIALLATAVIMASGAIWLEPRDSSRFSNDSYIATDRRLIIKRDGEDHLVSDWRQLQAYDIRRIGKVTDIVLSFDCGASDFSRQTLYALTNSDSLIKLVHKLS